MTGRDTNALSLGLGRVAGPWAAIHATSHCHLVVDDCAHNHAALFSELPLQTHAVPKAAQPEFIRGLSTERPLVVVSSAGRHGLRRGEASRHRAQRRRCGARRIRTASTRRRDGFSWQQEKTPPRGNGGRVAEARGGKDASSGGINVSRDGTAPSPTSF